jgi:hypothetical protein
MAPLHTEILRTLLYYDIWHHPLTAKELFLFLPVNSLTFDEFLLNLKINGPGSSVLSESSHFFLKGKSPAIVAQRKEKERSAKRLWHWARVSAHIIKRFPFVRGVFVSGDLSKNVTNKHSDVDFFIVTEPNRLWIARTMLILFKKVFLLNRKKFFCLNSFATSDHMTLEEQNVFVATEVAHLKPLYSSELFGKYLQANVWIRRFFPNYDVHELPLPKVNDRQSILQRIAEFVLSFFPLDALDTFLLEKMKGVWAKRYPEYDKDTRERIFRCTKYESRAYVGNFEEKILALYEQKLRAFGVTM